MAETTERSSVALAFMSNLGETVRLSVPRADMTLTTARVQSTMEDLISGGIIITGAGIPDAIHSAEIVTTTRQPLASDG